MMRPLSLVAGIVALFAMGCSDAPKRPAKIGLYVMIRNPSDPSVAGKTCPASSGIEWDTGGRITNYVCTGTGPSCPGALSRESCIQGGCNWTKQTTDVNSPSPSGPGKTLEDGKSNASISCVIRKNGSVNAEGGGIDPQITPPDGRINFTFGGNGKTAGNNLNVSFYTPLTQFIESSTSLPPCTVTTVHKQAPGALWASFSCPALIKSGEPNVACQASGTIVMEYCDTGEDE